MLGEMALMSSYYAHGLNRNYGKLMFESDRINLQQILSFPEFLRIKLNSDKMVIWQKLFSTL